MQNIPFLTDLKVNWGACKRTCGGSNNLNRIKIDPRKGVASDDFSSYWAKYSIDSAKNIAIKITISTCRKMFISSQIRKLIGKRVEELVAVLTIRFRIDPRKGIASDAFISYWAKDGISSAKKNAMKITISTCHKIFMS